nr:hypothetical protein [Pseudoponticoccus marisrubri]
MLKDILRAVEAHRPQKALRDRVNRLRFGANGPLSDMAIFPDPRTITESCAPRRGMRLRRQSSGRVLSGDWDLSRKPVSGSRKYTSCRMRWVEGADWEETPVFQDMLAKISRGEAPDECRTIEEVRERYARLDRIFAETKVRGRLLRMHELPNAYYRREHGAVLVHLARDGSCLRSGGGNHRFAIAKLLELPEMPAQLGVVHPDALRDEHLARLSRSRFGA